MVGPVSIRRLAGIITTIGCTLAPGAPFRAQSLLSEPLVLGGGRVTLGGDASLTYSCADTPEPGSCDKDTGFFNYSNYEHSTLRMIRADINAAVRASRYLSVLAEVRIENGTGLRPYALYVRLRPWAKRAFDIQAGRVPPTFGAFARRTYANDNVLIGYPLAYQYLTSLRSDSVPANADELLRMRGRGWLSSFSVGNPVAAHGVPLATAFLWDTGVQVHSALGWAEWAASVTTGSLANPLLTEDKAGKQMAGRLALHPLPGLAIGASAARGPFLTRAVTRSAGAGGPEGAFTQTALGADLEYSRDYYLLRVEAIGSRWILPTIDAPLRALAGSIEGRYKINPRFYAAARLDHLGFSSIAGQTRTASWDAPVTRAEIGGGYLIRRNLQLKLSVQRNTRDGGRVPRLTLGAAQVVFWF